MAPWPERLCYTVDEAIHAAGLSRRSLYRAMAEGHLKFSVVGSRRRIFPADLVKFLRGES